MSHMPVCMISSVPVKEMWACCQPETSVTYYIQIYVVILYSDVLNNIISVDRFDVDVVTVTWTLLTVSVINADCWLVFTCGCSRDHRAGDDRSMLSISRVGGLLANMRRAQVPWQETRSHTIWVQLGLLPWPWLKYILYTIQIVLIVEIRDVANVCCPSV